MSGFRFVFIGLVTVVCTLLLSSCNDYKFEEKGKWVSEFSYLVEERENELEFVINFAVNNTTDHEVYATIDLQSFILKNLKVPIEPLPVPSNSSTICTFIVPVVLDGDIPEDVIADLKSKTMSPINGVFVGASIPNSLIEFRD